LNVLGLAAHCLILSPLMNFLENKFTSALFSLKLHQFPLKYTNLARLSIFYVSKYDSMQDLSHGAAQIDPYS
jgi:hypothetical protein